MELTPTEIQTLKNADWEKKTIQVGNKPIYKYENVRVKTPSYETHRYFDSSCVNTQYANAVVAGLTIGISVLFGQGPDFDRCRRTRKIKYYPWKDKKTLVRYEPIMKEIVS